jgi:hypothetical protein
MRGMKPDGGRTAPNYRPFKLAVFEGASSIAIGPPARREAMAPIQVRTPASQLELAIVEEEMVDPTKPDPTYRHDAM